MTYAVLLAVVLLAAGTDARASAAPPQSAPAPADLDVVRAAKRAAAVRIDQPIRLDGVLDNAEMLYVGAMLYDPEPDRLITNELKRDFGGSSGDGVGLVLDTFQDRRSAYGFLTNPGGGAARVARLRQRPPERRQLGRRLVRQDRDPPRRLEPRVRHPVQDAPVS